MVLNHCLLCHNHEAQLHSLPRQTHKLPLPTAWTEYRIICKDSILEVQETESFWYEAVLTAGLLAEFSQCVC